MTFENIQSVAEGAETVEIPADMVAPGDGLDPPEGDMPPPRDLPDEDAPEARAAAFPLNDFGNGQRLMTYYGEDLLFVKRLGWFRWSGQRWVADEDEIEVRRDAQKIAAHILHEIPFIALDDWQRDALDLWHDVRSDYRELEAITPSDRSDEQKKRYKELLPIRDAGEEAAKALRTKRSSHASHAKNSGNTSKISNMVAEAKIAASTDVDSLNREKYMVNCLNGVVHFVKDIDQVAASFGQPSEIWRAELLPQKREQKISKMMQAEFRLDAKAPIWEAFLERVQPDQEVRTFLKRWFGYSMTGLTGEQKLAFLFGIGRNGKSTMVDTLAKLFDDYGTTLPIETLTGSEQRKGSDATPDLVRIPGARFVRASEPEQGQRMKEALIKALTGGEAIMIRRMHSEFIEVVPEFKLTISGNHKPEIRGADDGIWRRVMLVPFQEQIPDGEVDRDLPAKLEAERDGIMAWLVQGCLDYLQDGLPVPQAVVDATAEYRTLSDPMREFLTTQCEVTENPKDFESGRDLRDAFMAWQLDRGEKPWGARNIALRIRERMGVVKGPAGNSYTDAKTGGVTGYRCLKISEEATSRRIERREELMRYGGGM
jgi:putative DNA primase/helicase